MIISAEEEFRVLLESLVKDGFRLVVPFKPVEPSTTSPSHKFGHLILVPGALVPGTEVPDERVTHMLADELVLHNEVSDELVHPNEVSDAKPNELSPFRPMFNQNDLCHLYSFRLHGSQWVLKAHHCQSMKR